MAGCADARPAFFLQIFPICTLDRHFRDVTLHRNH